MLRTPSPKQHKALGRRVANFSEAKWDERKFEIVTQGNYYKFTISSDALRIRGLLLATGERELVEVDWCADGGRGGCRSDGRVEVGVGGGGGGFDPGRHFGIPLARFDDNRFEC